MITITRACSDHVSFTESLSNIFTLVIVMESIKFINFRLLRYTWLQCIFAIDLTFLVTMFIIALNVIEVEKIDTIQLRVKVDQEIYESKNRASDERIFEKQRNAASSQFHIRGQIKKNNLPNTMREEI